MPWEKQFDEEEVLDKAMAAFWRHGFKGTSMKCLVQETGLNPGSIYAAFHDKRSLFERCLDRYKAKTEAKWAGLAAGRSPRDAILGLFDMMNAEACEAGGGQGCMLINASLEGDDDPEIAEAVRTGMRGAEDFIRSQIEAGQAAGEIPADRDPAETARLILGVLTGARVIVRCDTGHPFVAESRAFAEHLLT